MKKKVGKEKITYARTSFKGEDIVETFKEDLDTEENLSVEKYGGFYIARYESGDEESTESKEMRSKEKYYNNSQGNSTNKVTIKKNQVPYNYIKYTDCIELSNEFATVNGYDTNKMFTKLCSSYAWDTTLNFLGRSYAENSVQGNYINIELKYKDINGQNNIKNKNDTILIPTGQTTPIKNIYDMGGNLYEYTTETGTTSTGSHIARGGSYTLWNVAESACKRHGYMGYAAENVGFRIALYIK